jgi:replicative DNA helicase
VNSAEYNLLGILATDKYWNSDPKTKEKIIDAMSVLKREYFSTDFGKSVFWAINEILKTDNVPDISLIYQKLENDPNISFSAIGEMVRHNSSAANVVKYAELTRSEYYLRHAKEKLSEAITELNTIGEPIPKIQSALNLISTVSTDYDMTNEDCSFDSAMDAMLEHLENVAEQGSMVTGLDTGYSRLNLVTHGLQNGNTIVVAGLPGGGKTTFCLNIMTHAAFNNKKNVLFYSLEMPKQEITMKVSSQLTNIPMSAFQTAEVITDRAKSKIFGNAMPSYQDVNFVIDDDSSITAESIENRTKKHELKMGGIDLICVDYLTLMDAQGESETVRASNAAKSLKRLAKKFNCPVIIISQFVKNVVGRPTKADLRQTGQLGQDASLILFLHKDDNQVVESGQRKLVELIIDKNRMGETCDLYLEPYFETNKLIETEREIAFPIDSNGQPVRGGSKKLNRV